MRGGWLIGLGLFALIGGIGAALWIGPGERELTDEEVRGRALAMVRETVAGRGLDGDIAAALDHDSPEEAEDLIQLADAAGLAVDPALRARLAEETSGLRAHLRTAKRLGKGFITGEGEDDVSLAAAIASDLTVVGDVRSLGGETLNYLRGQPVDEFVVGLSLAGVGMTAATLASGGATLPARMGVSMVKMARTGGRLTKAFSAELSKLVARTADLPGLKRRIAAGEDAMTAAYRHAATLDAAALRRVVGAVGNIGEATSVRATLGVLRHVDDVQDLTRAERMAKAMKTSTAGGFRVVGKGLLRAAGTAAVLGWQALTALGVALLGLLMSLAGFVVSSVVWWAARRLARRGGGIVAEAPGVQGA